MKLDEANEEGSPGRNLHRAWASLTVGEAKDLLERLSAWHKMQARGQLDDGWHTHLTDTDGNELTIEIGD